jgi:hypothetical protein
MASPKDTTAMTMPPPTGITTVHSSPSHVPSLTTNTANTIPTPSTIGMASPAVPPATLEQLAASDLEITKRRSIRLATQPVSSVDPVTCARHTKLKKLGLAKEAEDAKVIKKRQLLEVYNSPARDMAENVMCKLLNIQAQTA